MAIRTRRARMLSKLMYLLYQQPDDKLSFAQCVAKTVKIFESSFSKQVKFRNAYMQLVKDYQYFMDNCIEDDIFLEGPEPV